MTTVMNHGIRDILTSRITADCRTKIHGLVDLYILILGSFDDIFQQRRFCSFVWYDLWTVNWKGYGRKWLCLILGHYSSICAGRTEKNHEDLRSGYLASGSGFKPRIFRIRIRRSITLRRDVLCVPWRLWKCELFMY